MAKGIIKELDEETGEILFISLMDSDKTTWEIKPGMICEITGCSPSANRYGRKCKILRFEDRSFEVVAWIQYLDTNGRAKFKNFFELVPIGNEGDSRS